VETVENGAEKFRTDTVPLPSHAVDDLFVKELVDRLQLIGPVRNLLFEPFAIKTQLRMHFSPVGTIAHPRDDNDVDDDSGDKEQPGKELSPRPVEQHKVREHALVQDEGMDSRVRNSGGRAAIAEKAIVLLFHS
jgi:hypothetical protein